MVNIDTTSYKPFFVQKMKSGYTKKNSLDWGIAIKKFQLDYYPEMKDIPKNDWYDQDGDEEFIPDVPYYKAYESDIEFVYQGATDTGIGNITNFLDYISRNGYNYIYDSYSKVGRQNVRYVKMSDAKMYRSGGNEYIIFKVTLKFNDPKTIITL